MRPRARVERHVPLPRGKKNWPPKVCPYCNQAFGPKPGHSTRDWRTITYCSRDCSAKSRAIPLADRLATNSIQCDAGCIEWTAGVDKKGYGRIGANKFSREVVVHRIAWELANGPITNGLHVLHDCDNPPCFNINHLYLGTNDDNVRDRIARGRGVSPKGTVNGRAKLNTDAVLAIRADRRRAIDIAPEYDVSPSTVNAIRRGEAWRHI